MFSVSVIIPVFNAAEFLFSSVTSAVDLEEVNEVILVEDGSIDESFNECLKLERSYEKVKVFRHLGGLNKGPSASRNLGVSMAKSPFISFLDADDWYLPNRFVMDKERFSELENIDAVYSCSIRDKDFDKKGNLYGVNSKEQSNLEPRLAPMKFYEQIVRNKLVLFDTNSITIRRSFLQKFRLFDERLNLHQDIELWKRLMREGNFVAGEWQKPVSVYRRHPGNRITSKSWQSNLKMIRIHIDNLGLENLQKFEIEDIYRRIWRKKSEKYNNTWQRRFFFFSNYYLNFFHKKFILEKLRTGHGID